MPSPVLTDPRGNIRLRFPQNEDLEGIYTCARESIREISPWMDWSHSDYSKDETEVWLRQLPDSWISRQSYVFLVERLDGLPLGTCGLSHPNWKHRLANLGYWIRTSQAGQGYATRASHLLAQWAFSALELTRLEIIMGLKNEASRRVAEKLQAHHEGVLRNRLYVGQTLLDAHSYSLVPTDLEKSPA